MFKKCLDMQQGTGAQESRRLILNGHFIKGDAFKDSTFQEGFTLCVKPIEFTNFFGSFKGVFKGHERNCRTFFNC